MQLSIEELLFLASSAIILPVIAVLTVAFFSGGLTDTENAKYLASDDSESDFWSIAEPTVAVAAVPLPTAAYAPIPRGGEQE
jgi:hypothetical protein